MQRMRVNGLMLVLSLAIFTGCTALKLIESTKINKPEIKFDNYTIETPTDKKVVAMLLFNAHNPNEIGLKNVFVSYELFTEGKRFLQGSDIAITLVPNGDTKIEVPAEIIYKDVFKALGPIAKKVVQKKNTLPVTAKIVIYGKPTVYNEVEEGAFFAFSFSTTQTMDVPIPHDEINNATKKARQKLKKLF